jgi:hypothetical protein
MATAILLGALLPTVGCGQGSGSNSTSSSTPRLGAPPEPARKSSPGVGMSAPVSKVIVARRTGGRHSLVSGLQTNGASGCPDLEGRPEIGLYTDVPAPDCVRATPTQRLLVVNRSGAYRRSEGHPEVVRLGPFSARLLPQEAVLFKPLGSFLGRGLHQVTVDGGNRGAVLVEPTNCAILRPEPGEPLCFSDDRVGRLRRWRRTEARLGAPACRGSDLVLNAERHSSIGAGGTIYTKFFVTNRSRRPCTVAGVPKAVGIDRGGKAIQVAVPRPNLRPTADGGRLRIKLAGGRSATFVIAHYDGIGAGRCRPTSTYGLRITIPGAGLRRVVRYPMGYCPAPDAGLGLRVGRIE